MHQAEPQHVNRRLALFENDTPIRLIHAVARLHVEKQHFAVDRIKAFHADFRRTPCRRLDRIACVAVSQSITRIITSQFAQSSLPSLWE